MLYRTGDTRSRDIVVALGSTVFGVLSLAVLALDLVTFAAQERPPAGQSVPLYRGGVEVVNVAATVRGISLPSPRRLDSPPSPWTSPPRSSVSYGHSIGSSGGVLLATTSSTRHSTRRPLWVSFHKQLVASRAQLAPA